MTKVITFFPTGYDDQSFTYTFDIKIADSENNLLNPTGQLYHFGAYTSDEVQLGTLIQNIQILYNTQVNNVINETIIESIDYQKIRLFMSQALEKHYLVYLPLKQQCIQFYLLNEQVNIQIKLQLSQPLQALIIVAKMITIPNQVSDVSYLIKFKYFKSDVINDINILSDILTYNQYIHVYYDQIQDIMIGNGQEVLQTPVKYFQECLMCNYFNKDGEYYHISNVQDFVNHKQQNWTTGFNFIGLASIYILYQSGNLYLANKDTQASITIEIDNKLGLF